MIFNMTGGGSGSGATLVVSCPANVTVTVSKDDKSYTKNSGNLGSATFKGLATGEWTVTIEGNEQTATKNITITADYAITMAFFAAYINITYPANSNCVVTNSGGQTVASNTNTGSSTKTWTATVNATGAYTVTATATDGSKTKSTTVNITTDGQSESVTLTYILYLRNGIDDCDADTGGWISEARAWGENVAGAGAPIVDKSNTTWIVLTQNYEKGGLYRTVNKIDLSQYNMLVVELAVSATDSHPEYFTFGIWSELGTYYKYNMAAYWNPTSNIGSTVINIDISKLNGSYYVGYGLYNNNLTVASGYVYLK